MGEMQHGVCGSSLDIAILWSHYMVQQVLRALPAETKVDGLPRASSILAFMIISVSACSTRSLAVTWLTVYRQLQVPVRIVLGPRRIHNYVGAGHR